MNRILIVEDDRDIAGNLLLLLKKEGFTAVAVGTREESLEQIRRESFDLVLLDLMLPDGNGYSVCTAIKREADIPVIFLTAMGDEESVVTGFELGADDYIAKPFRPLELVSRVKNVLRRRGRSRSVLRAGDLLVDTVKGTVTRDGQEIILSALVSTPGVYGLPAGSRVYEAIEAAGGFSEAAVPDYLNLAQVLEDGMKIQVPDREQAEEWKARGLTQSGI